MDVYVHALPIIWGVNIYCIKVGRVCHICMLPLNNDIHVTLTQ